MGSRHSQMHFGVSPGDPSRNSSPTVVLVTVLSTRDLNVATYWGTARARVSGLFIWG